MSDEQAGYAVTVEKSKGRRFFEKPHSYRSSFERDRDRIIHSESFRRLEGKTQVFSPGLDDSYRNRLTHSIEVSQIGRTIAKFLAVNGSLTEGICLGHDLGHPPFGHTGETVLAELLSGFGGFEHNLQSLRLVDLLEHPYPDFFGLNLMYETRLGLYRHRGPYDKPGGGIFAEKNCSAEGQISNLADRIAYNCHDLEDGMRAGLIDSEQLEGEGIELFSLSEEHIKAEGIEDVSVRRTRIAKSIIDILVSDCIDASRGAIERAGIESLEDVYEAGGDVVVLSEGNDKRLRELEGFLLRNFYQHSSLQPTKVKVKDGLGRLFEHLCKNREAMPRFYQGLIDKEGVERVAADYIAGMTDRFCFAMLEGI